MKLTGYLFLDGKRIRSVKAECNDPEKDFHDRFEYSFVKLCRDLYISVPVWLQKNTKELSMCKKTSFYSDQFNEEFLFDRLEMRIDRI
jgi:hypothetical protein